MISLKRKWSKESFEHYIATLKYSLYCMTHPLDCFWDLTHEKRGSMAAANTILVLTLAARIMNLQFTGIVCQQVYWEGINIFLYLASILFPFLLWCVGNWALTTLFDGKGTLKQVYMASCYAIAPYPLFQFPLIILSNIITVDEYEFYAVLSNLSVAWCAVLLITAMMEIHEYKVSKTILCTIGTIFAMLIMIFILLLFFSMISQGIAYFVSLYREIIFRM